MVLRWMIGCSFVFLLWFGFHANLPMSNSTWPGPVGENYSNSPAGSGRSPFQDNACHHLYNRQHRSHAPTRAATLQSKSGLSCRARLCLGFYLGHTITGELSKGVSGSYNHRKAVACAPTKIAAYLIEKIGSTVSGYFHPSLWLSESHDKAPPSVAASTTRARWGEWRRERQTASVAEAPAGAGGPGNGNARGWASMPISSAIWPWWSL